MTLIITIGVLWLAVNILHDCIKSPTPAHDAAKEKAKRRPHELLEQRIAERTAKEEAHAKLRQQWLLEKQAKATKKTARRKQQRKKANEKAV